MGAPKERVQMLSKDTGLPLRIRMGRRKEVEEGICFIFKSSGGTRFGSPGAGVMRSYALPDMSTGNPVLVLFRTVHSLNC